MGFQCGRLYKRGDAVFCCEGCHGDVVHLSADDHRYARAQGWERWRDVTDAFEGCERGITVLYTKLNGWTDVGIVLTRCYVACNPALLLRSYAGVEVLVAILGHKKVEVGLGVPARG